MIKSAIISIAMIGVTIVNVITTAEAVEQRTTSTVTSGFNVRGNLFNLEGVMFKHIRKAGGTTIDKHIKRVLQVPAESGLGWRQDDPVSLALGWQKRGNMMVKLGTNVTAAANSTAAANVQTNSIKPLRVPRYYMQEYGAMDPRCLNGMHHNANNSTTSDDVAADIRSRWLLVLSLRDPISRHWSEYWYAGPGHASRPVRNMVKLFTGVKLKMGDDTTFESSDASFVCAGYYRKIGPSSFMQFALPQWPVKITIKTIDPHCTLSRHTSGWWLMPPRSDESHEGSTPITKETPWCNPSNSTSVPTTGWISKCDVANRNLSTVESLRYYHVDTLEQQFADLKVETLQSQFYETVRTSFKKWVMDHRDKGLLRTKTDMKRGTYYPDFHTRSMLGDCYGDEERASPSAHEWPDQEFRTDFICALGPWKVDGGCFWNTLRQIDQTHYDRVRDFVSQFDIVLLTENMSHPSSFKAIDFALSRFFNDHDVLGLERKAVGTMNQRRSSLFEMEETLGPDLLGFLRQDNAWDYKLYNSVIDSRLPNGLKKNQRGWD